MTVCPDCGKPMTLPATPGPILTCDCGWYMMGALRDDDE